MEAHLTPNCRDAWLSPSAGIIHASVPEWPCTSTQSQHQHHLTGPEHHCQTAMTPFLNHLPIFVSCCLFLTKAEKTVDIYLAWFHKEKALGILKQHKGQVDQVSSLRYPKEKQLQPTAYADLMVHSFKPGLRTVVPKWSAFWPSSEREK